MIEFWDIGNSEIRGAIDFFLDNLEFVGDPFSAGRPLFTGEALVFAAAINICNLSIWMQKSDYYSETFLDCQMSSIFNNECCLLYVV